MANDHKREQLEALRASIDATDDSILQLIHQRANLARQVGEVKERDASTPFYVPSREASIIRRILTRNADFSKGMHASCIPDTAIHGIYREVIGACLALEHPMNIAYLGPAGTFTYAAAQRQFGATASYLACDHFAMVFDAVESGRANYGVVPIENAFEGAVTPVLDLFADADRQIQVCAEVQLSIHHHLFTFADQLSNIDCIISHPQPLGQCRRWLQEHLPQAQWRETNSTVKAASMIEAAKAGKQNGIDWQRTAAIGPYAITHETTLPLLQQNIEDFHDNITRFLVIGQHDSPPSGQDKTLLVASLHDQAGALNNLLRPFAERGISLSRIESRPSRKRHWQYFFCIDILGHRDEAHVQQAFADIKKQDVNLLMRGSYPVSTPL
ncbi:MAG: prephenate dehydratase [Mariprofundaceae bacterium]|nr:prephenate dehydratase [Mariprofundaceae bacterium]